MDKSNNKNIVENFVYLNTCTPVGSPAGSPPIQLSTGYNNGVVAELCASPDANNQAWNAGWCMPATLSTGKTQTAADGQHTGRVCQHKSKQRKDSKSAINYGLAPGLEGKMMNSTCTHNSECPGLCGEIDSAVTAQNKKPPAVLQQDFLKHRIKQDARDKVNKDYWELGSMHSFHNNVNTGLLAKTVATSDQNDSQEQISINDVRRANGLAPVSTGQATQPGVSQIHHMLPVDTTKKLSDQQIGQHAKTQKSGGSPQMTTSNHIDPELAKDTKMAQTTQTAETAAAATAAMAGARALGYSTPVGIIGGAVVGAVIGGIAGADAAASEAGAALTRAQANPISGVLANNICVNSDILVNKAPYTDDDDLKLALENGYPWGFIGDDGKGVAGTSSDSGNTDATVDPANKLQLDKVANKYLNPTYDNATKRIQAAMKRYEEHESSAQQWGGFTAYWPSSGYLGTTTSHEMALGAAKGALCSVTMGFMDECKGAGSYEGNAKLLANNGCLPGFSRVDPDLIKSKAGSGNQPQILGWFGGDAGGSTGAPASASTGTFNISGAGGAAPKSNTTSGFWDKLGVSSAGKACDPTAKSATDKEKCHQSERPVCIKNRQPAGNYLQCVNNPTNKSTETTSILPDFTAGYPGPSIPGIDNTCLWVYPLKEPGVCTVSEYGKTVEQKYSNGCSSILSPEQCKYGTNQPLVYNLTTGRKEPYENNQPGYPHAECGPPKKDASGAMITSLQPYTAPVRVLLYFNDPIGPTAADKLTKDTIVTQGNTTGVGEGNARAKIVHSAAPDDLGIILELLPPISGTELTKIVAAYAEQEKIKRQSSSVATESFVSKSLSGVVEEQEKKRGKVQSLSVNFQPNVPFTTPTGLATIVEVAHTPGGNVSSGGTAVCRWQDLERINYTYKLLNCAVTDECSIGANTGSSGDTKTAGHSLDEWLNIHYKGSKMWPPIPPIPSIQDSNVNMWLASQGDGLPRSPDPGSCPVFRGQKGAFNYLQNWCQNATEKWNDVCLLPEVWASGMGGNPKDPTPSGYIDLVTATEQKWNAEKSEAAANLQNFWAASCSKDPRQRHCNRTSGAGGDWLSPNYLLSGNIMNVQPLTASVRYIRVSSVDPPRFILCQNPLGKSFAGDTTEYDADFVPGSGKEIWWVGNVLRIINQPHKTVSGAFSGQWEVASGFKSGDQRPDAWSEEILFNSTWDDTKNTCTTIGEPTTGSPAPLPATSPPSRFAWPPQPAPGHTFPPGYTPPPASANPSETADADGNTVTKPNNMTIGDLPSAGSNQKTCNTQAGINLMPGLRYEPGPILVLVQEYNLVPLSAHKTKAVGKQNLSGNFVIQVASVHTTSQVQSTAAPSAQPAQPAQPAQSAQSATSANFTPVDVSKLNNMLFKPGTVITTAVTGSIPVKYTVTEVDVVHNMIAIAPPLKETLNENAIITVLATTGEALPDMVYAVNNNAGKSQTISGGKKYAQEVHIRNIPTWFGWDPTNMVNAASKIINISSGGAISSDPSDHGSCPEPTSFKADGIAATPPLKVATMSAADVQAYHLVFQAFGIHIQQQPATLENFHIKIPTSTDNPCAQTEMSSMPQIASQGSAGAGLMTPAMKMCWWAAVLPHLSQATAGSVHTDKFGYDMLGADSSSGSQSSSLGIKAICEMQIGSACSSITPDIMKSQETAQKAATSNSALGKVLGAAGNVDLQRTCGCYMPSDIYAQDVAELRQYGINMLSGADRCVSSEANGMCPNKSCFNKHCMINKQFSSIRDGEGGACAMPEMPAVGTTLDTQCSGSTCIQAASINVGSGTTVMNSSFNINQTCATGQGGMAVDGGVPCVWDEDCSHLSVLEKTLFEAPPATPGAPPPAESVQINDADGNPISVDPTMIKFQYHCVNDWDPAPNATGQRYCRPTWESSLYPAPAPAPAAPESFANDTDANDVQENFRENATGDTGNLKLGKIFQNPCSQMTCGKCFNNNSDPGNGSGYVLQTDGTTADSSTYLAKFRKTHSNIKKGSDGSPQTVVWKTIPQGLPGAGNSYELIYTQMQAGRCIPCEITGDCTNMPAPANSAWPKKWGTSAQTGEATCLQHDEDKDGNLRYTHPNPNATTSASGGPPKSSARKKFWLPKSKCETSADCCGKGTTCNPQTGKCDSPKYFCNPDTFQCAPAKTAEERSKAFAMEQACNVQCKPWFCNIGDAWAHQGHMGDIYRDTTKPDAPPEGLIFYVDPHNRPINQKQINAYYWKFVSTSSEALARASVNYSWDQPTNVGDLTKGFSMEYPIIDFTQPGLDPALNQRVLETGRNENNGKHWFSLMLLGSTKPRYYVNVTPVKPFGLKVFSPSKGVSIHKICGKEAFQTDRWDNHQKTIAFIVAYSIIAAMTITGVLVNKFAFKKYR